MFVLLGFLTAIIVAAAVHGFGHYIAARFFRVRVTRFSVGLGTPLWRRVDKRGTEWVLAPIPLGGYVRLAAGDDERPAPGGRGMAAEFAGERADRARKEDVPVSFLETMESRPPWQRFIVHGAGPLANFILAAALYTALGMMGERQIRPVVGEVRAESPAANAGFQVGDEIAMVNNRPVDSWSEVWAHFVDAVAEGEAVSARTATGVERRIPAGELSLDDLADGLHRGVGLWRDFSYVTSKIARVEEDSPAALAGVAEGDVIVLINDAFVEDFTGVIREVVKHRRRGRVTLVLWRNGAEVSVVAHLGEKQGTGGYLGVEPAVDQDKYAAVAKWVRHGAADAALLGIARVAEAVAGMFKFLWRLSTFQLGAEHLSGPVGIAAEAGKAADLGLEPFLRFLALIVVNLGAINLVPLPLLDGGQMLLCVIQFAQRRPLSDRARARLELLGMALIVGLMTFVTINHLLKL